MKRCTERTEQLQFAGVPFGRSLQSFKKLQALGEVADRLDMGEPVSRPQPRPQAILDRLLDDPGFGEMLREQFRLRLHQVRKPRFHHLGNPLMKVATFPVVDRVMQRFLEQGMLKLIDACGRLALDVENAGGNHFR